MGCGGSNNSVPPENSAVPGGDKSSGAASAGGPKLKNNNDLNVILLVTDSKNMKVLTKKNNIFQAVAVKNGAGLSKETFAHVLHDHWGWQAGVDEDDAEAKKVITPVRKTVASLSKQAGLNDAQIASIALYESVINLANGGSYAVFVCNVKEEDVAGLANGKEWSDVSEVEQSTYASLGHCENVLEASKDWMSSCFVFGTGVGEPLKPGLYLASFFMKMAGKSLQLILNNAGSTMLPFVQLGDEQVDYKKSYYKTLIEEAKEGVTYTDEQLLERKVTNPVDYATLKATISAGVKELREVVDAGDGKASCELSSLVGAPLKINNETQLLVLVCNNTGVKDDMVVKDLHRFNMFHTKVHNPILKKAANQAAAAKPPMPGWMVSILRSNMSPTQPGNKHRGGKERYAANKARAEALRKKMAEAEEQRKKQEEEKRKKALEDPSSVEPVVKLQDKLAQTEAYIQNMLADNPQVGAFIQELMSRPETMLNVEALKTAVGDTVDAASFNKENVQDCFGNPWDLEAELKDNCPIVLCFYRGEWCPICNMQMKAFSDRMEDIAACGNAKIVAISCELPDQTMTTQEKMELRFKCISDPDFNVIRPLGLSMVYPANNQMSASVDLREYYQLSKDLDEIFIPIPGVYVLDPTGKVLFHHVTQNFVKRATPDDVIAALTAAGYAPAAQEETAPVVVAEAPAEDAA